MTLVLFLGTLGAGAILGFYGTMLAVFSTMKKRMPNSFAEFFLFATSFEIK